MTTPIPAPHGFRAELRAMLRLSIPLALGHLGVTLMGVVDTIVVGRVSPDALAAVAIGNVYLFNASAFGLGLMMALDPIIAQAVGAKDDDAITRGLQRGILLAIAISIPTAVLLWPGDLLLPLLRQQPELVPTAAAYARIQVLGILPFYLFIALRQTLQAMHRTAAIVGVIVLANVVNLLLNWVFVFGNWGVSPMGAVGSSWATALSRCFMAIALLALGWPHLRPYLLPWHPRAFDWGALGRMFRLGAPIGVQMSLEFGIFGVVGLLMGSIGVSTVAGHQVALSLASFTFMVPLGVSGAAAVLVGNAVGRGDPAEARRAALAGLTIGVAFMALSTAAMIAQPTLIARLYTNQDVVVAVAASLIPLAGLFQVFDGIQVVAIGILRGVADTRAPMIINVVGFWFVGLPVCAWLGFRTSMGPRGLWWGLVIGLAVVAVILLARVRSRMAGDIRRVSIDTAEIPVH